MLELKHLLPSNTKRKQRTVKNADVDIDDVLAPPGYRYANWIRITKQKLIERESKVMDRRLVIIQNIINEEIESFNTNIINKHAPHININSAIYCNIMIDNFNLFKICLNKLAQYINKWNGVSLIHMKRKLSTFREYFAIGKSWFDQRKKQILATDLWIVVFGIILQMSATIGNCFQEPILQRLFETAILLQVSFRMFEAKLSSPASRPHHLLNLSILKDSIQFKEYLAKHIIEVKEDELKKEYKNKKITAQILMNHIVKQLNELSNQSKIQFINELNKYYSSTNISNIPTLNINTNSLRINANNSNNMLNSLNSCNQLNKQYLTPHSSNHSNSVNSHTDADDSVSSPVSSYNAFDDYNVTLHAEGIITDLGLPIPFDYNTPYMAIKALQIPNVVNIPNYTQHMSTCKYHGCHHSTVFVSERRFKPIYGQESKECLPLCYRF